MMLEFLFSQLFGQSFHFLSQESQIILLCRLGSKAWVGGIGSWLSRLRGRSLCSAPSDPIFSPTYQILSRLISSNRRIILLKETLPALYQILKSLGWVSLLDQLLKLGIDPLLLPEIAARCFVFPRRFSLRLILFREKVRDVFSKCLDFFTNTFLRHVKQFLARLVQIGGVSATGVVIFVWVLWNMAENPWLIYFNDLSLLSTSELSRFVFKTVTTPIGLMTGDDFLVRHRYLFGQIFLPHPLIFRLKLRHNKLW